MTTEKLDKQQLSFITHSPDDTRTLGMRLGRLLQPGDVISLFGELGAGKTTFIQGLAKGLEVTEPVTSPSFTLIHEHAGRVRLYHMDLYRLEAEDLAEAGVEEALTGDAVAALEWAERAPRGLRGDALEVDIAFANDDDDTRLLRFRSTGPRSRIILASLREV